MKIAILSRYQKTVNRGVESFVTELSSRLSKNHEVQVFSGKDSDDIGKIISGKFDIVMPTNGRMQSLKTSLGRMTGHYKLVIAGESGIGRDDIWNIAITKPDVFVALTDQMADWAKKWAWGSRVVKIPNGVDLEKFSKDGKKFNHGLKSPVILSVGALEWYKHHELTINAMVNLLDASLLIVGKGEKESDLKKLAEEKIPGRFKIINLSYEEIPDVYRSADIFALPSWDREAFGIVYLEAMASGLPVVALNDSARREIVGDAGILVDVDDSEKYAEAIKKTLDEKWEDLPRKQAEKFSWEIVAQKYQELFESFEKGPQGGGL